MTRRLAVLAALLVALLAAAIPAALAGSSPRAAPLDRPVLLCVQDAQLQWGFCTYSPFSS